MKEAVSKPLTKAELDGLRSMSPQGHWRYFAPRRDGSGRVQARVRQSLKRLGLVEHKAPSRYFWRLTDAGRTALATTGAGHGE